MPVLRPPYSSYNGLARHPMLRFSSYTPAAHSSLPSAAHIKALQGTPSAAHAPAQLISPSNTQLIAQYSSYQGLARHPLRSSCFGSAHISPAAHSSSPSTAHNIARCSHSRQTPAHGCTASCSSQHIVHHKETLTTSCAL